LEFAMPAKTTSVTAARPNYRSGVYAVYGTLPDGLQSLADLKTSHDTVFVSIDETTWASILSHDFEPGETRRAIANLAEMPLLGLACFGDLVWSQLLRVQETIGVGDATQAAAIRTSLNKATLYTELTRHGVPVADFVWVPSVEGLGVTLEQFGVPLDDLIIKPAIGTGSEGVYRPRSRDTTDAVVRAVAAGLPVRDIGGLIVMRHLSGPGDLAFEVSADGLFAEGALLAFTVGEKVRRQRDTVFRDRVIVFPPRDPVVNALEEQLRNTTLSVLRAIGSRDSVFHIEFRFDTNGRPIPIDVALRPGGGFVSEAVRATTGVDLRLLHILHSAGPPDAPRRLGAPGAVTGAAAIGAFYRRQTTSFTAEDAGVVEAAVAARTDVIAYHLISELTRSEFVEPDAGLSLCVAAATPDAALTLLNSLVASWSFH
jgi:biotin carboxylase